MPALLLLLPSPAGVYVCMYHESACVLMCMCIYCVCVCVHVCVCVRVRARELAHVPALFY